MSDTDLKGKIIRGVGGVYYVHIDGRGLYACRARGIFRKLGIKPLPGDDVLMDITDKKDMEGSITQILPRKNTIIRPAAVNVDQAMIIFAFTKPEANLNLLDRFLILMGQQDVDVIICFNKTDLAGKEAVDRIRKIYEGSGCKLLFVSVRNEEGLEEVRKQLHGKTTLMAGPSGVGKSSITNALYPEACMQTGGLSEKTSRGRHTTRHTELFAIGDNTYIMDTPGFSSMYVFDMEKEELKYYYPEYDKYMNSCRFSGCNHMDEPGCAVKDAVEGGQISKTRYDNYRQIYEEIADKGYGRAKRV